MSIWRVGVLNDLHIPYHDEQAIGLLLNIFKDAKVNEIVLNGDVLDFYTLNSHGPKHPDIKETLESELSAGKDFLTQLRAMFPDEKITFLYGNHEFRLDRFVMDKCPLFWNILKLDVQLGLEALRIDWLPYQHPYSLNKKLKVVHSPPSYGVNGARTSLLKKMDINYIYACTHRVQHSCLTGGSGEVYHAWFNGWLGDINSYDKQVFSFMKGHESWQKAGIIADIIDDEEFHVHQVHLNGHTATWGDKYYDFRER